ncbi:MAG: type II toxin-antitoxin system mRNA interferase toxin, RelE/StbE family [Candidatus Paceibacterota bacterium]
MKIFYTKKFNREYKKINKDLKLTAESKELIFRKDPFSRTLKTHKLSGELEGFWSFSVDYKNRVVFEFISAEVVFFHTIGDHDVYK